MAVGIKLEKEKKATLHHARHNNDRDLSLHFIARFLMVFN